MNMQIDFDPLLPPGLHDFQEDQIDEHFVNGFSESVTRPALVANFRKYLEQLKNIKLAELKNTIKNNEYLDELYKFE